MLLLYNQGTYF